MIDPMCPACRARHIRRVYGQQDALRRRATVALQALDRPLSQLPKWFTEAMVTGLEREAAEGAKTAPTEPDTVD